MGSERIDMGRKVCQGNSLPKVQGFCAGGAEGRSASLRPVEGRGPEGRSFELTTRVRCREALHRRMCRAPVEGVATVLGSIWQSGSVMQRASQYICGVLAGPISKLAEPPMLQRVFASAVMLHRSQCFARSSTIFCQSKQR